MVLWCVIACSPSLARASGTAGSCDRPPLQMLCCMLLMCSVWSDLRCEASATCVIPRDWACMGPVLCMGPSVLPCAPCLMDSCCTASSDFIFSLKLNVTGQLHPQATPNQCVFGWRAVCACAKYSPPHEFTGRFNHNRVDQLTGSYQRAEYFSRISHFLLA